MNFKNIAIVTAIIAFVLGIGYLFFGSVIIGRWQIEPTENVILLGRRMGSFYLGLSVIFFLSRAIPLSVARRALTIGAAITLSLLTFLSIYEYIADRVGSGILVSAAFEFLLALGYVRLLIVERNSVIKV